MNVDSKYNSLFQLIKRLVSHYIEDVKLSSSEKLTLLLSGIATFAIVLILVMLGLVFLAISIANLLDTILASYYSYLIIGGLFIICAVLLIVLRKEIILNPIARFVSKLLLDPPVNKSDDNN